MMIPTVTRTTEEMLLTVPNSIREAALGLGVPNWRSVLSITLKTASPGVITGCMLAFARVAGETAPLLFTALGNQFMSTDLNRPIQALPLQIYLFAISPYDDQHRLAWAGALVLIVLIVLAVSPGALRCQPRHFEGSKLVGVGIEVTNLNAWYGTNHTLQDINLPIPANHRHGADRTLGLRQVYLCALPKPHARDESHCARYRLGACRRPGYLRRRIAGRGSPPHRHGLSAAQHRSLRCRSTTTSLRD